MYEYIKGLLVDRDEDYIVIETGNIGYHINCPFQISSELGQLDKEVKVYLYQNVKEDDISLFGFVSKQQKDMFLLLITVSGIGPKVALSICSQISPDKLALSVLSGDVKQLTTVKGLGKKGAERIILELKDKLKGKQVSDPVSVTAPVNVSDTGVSIINDTVTALEVLGYKADDVRDTVISLYTDDVSLEQLIRMSLGSLSRR